MDLPVIMAVDDDLTSLAILDRELHSRYEHAYRVVTKQSAKAALDELQRRHDAGQPIALVLADQWMPEMEGAELLGRVRFIDPLARRVMLVNWGDSSSPETIYHSCAYGLIEYFMNKPWHTGTDERFHHDVSEQLYQWSRANQPVFEAVKIVAERWSARAHELRDLLEAQRRALRLLPGRLARGRGAPCGQRLWTPSVGAAGRRGLRRQGARGSVEPRDRRGHRREEPARGRRLRPGRRRRRPGGPGRRRLRLLRGALHDRPGA